MQSVRVNMLGDLLISYGDNLIRETDNRSRRVWGLLAFLICHRGTPVSQYTLVEQLWGGEEIVNPENALRILLHRTRNQLDQLYEGAGRECILRKAGSYCWNPDVPLVADYERFEELCQRMDRGPEDRLNDLLEALALYQGEFLSRQTSFSWIVPIASHFQNLFLDSCQEAVQLLTAQARYEEALHVCHRCLAVDPYYEPVCRQLMQTHAAMNNPQAAAEFYEDLSQRLFDDFGIHPSEETRAIYRQVAHSPEERTFSMDEVLEHLQEPENAPGALMCDYDYFKILCYAERRSIERSGNVAHLALFTITASPDKPLNKRSLDRISEKLGQIIRRNLRRGDVLSRCSGHQYVLLLPQANYENSCMVCRRVISAFQRVHPYVSARISYQVQPLSPNYQLP